MSDATNPAPRQEGRPLGERVSWLDMASVVENEAGRRRIRVGELLQILLSSANMPAIERENVDSIIRRLVREAAAFDGVSRLIDRARTDSTILARLVAITRAESAQADGGNDEIRYE